MKKLIVIILFFIPFFINAQALIASWKFNGNSNEPINSLNCTDSAIATYPDGVLNQCINYASKGHSNIGVNKISPLMSGASLSVVTFWVKYTGTLFANDGGNVIFKANRSEGQVSFIIGISGATNTGKLRAVFRADAGSARSGYSSTVLSADTWYYIAAMCDYANDYIYIFVNGVLETSTAAAFTATSYTVDGTPATTAPDCIGYQQSGLYYLNGSIDELEIYKGNPGLGALKNKFTFRKGCYQ